jgi:hypothetical protein
MPIVTRRRIQSMLKELRPRMSDGKVRNLVGDLNNKRVKQVLGAEAELCLTWSFAQLYEVEIEPTVSGSDRTPDLRVKNLIAGESAFIEFTAVSDADFSGDAEMRPIAQALTGLANQTRKGSGKFLEFDFHEVMGFEQRQFVRRLLAPVNFVLNDEISKEFAAWLRQADAAAQPLVLQRDGLKVTIRYRSYALKHLDYRGRTVPAFYHLKDNPVYRRLDEKRARRQLPIGKSDVMCGIILWDAGCWTMRNPSFVSPHAVSVDQVVRTFIDDSGIDFVSVFSPWRQHIRGRSGVVWRQRTSTRPGDSRFDQIDRSMERIARTLPRPRFEGYQARANQDRKMYDPQAQGWYLAPALTSWGNERMEVRISARALLDALASEDFRGVASRYASGGGDTNFFLQERKKGRVIHTCRVEPGGVDEDDDYLVFEFAEDASASPFVVPPTKPADNNG